MIITSNFPMTYNDLLRQYSITEFASGALLSLKTSFLDEFDQLV